jgi:methylmalonyl-CoA mutase
MLNRLDFKKPTEKEWQQAAEKLLAGRSLGDTLYRESPEGLTIKPIYFAGDKPDVSVTTLDSNWLIAQTLFTANKEFNLLAREVLYKGQSALNINLDISSQLDYEINEQSAAALHITDFQTLFDLLDGVEPEKVPLFFNAFNTADRFYKWILDLSDKRGLDPAALSVALGADPISAALIYGSLFEPIAKISENWKRLLKESTVDFKPAFITINADIIHNSGGHKIQQLQYILGSVTTYVNSLLDMGIEPARTLVAIRIKVAVGNEQFMEIAKLRAIRLLCDNICKAYQVQPVNIPIDVVTSWRFLSDRDIYNNMLRASSQAFAAVAGGCDSLDVLPFDLALKQPNEFSLRQARNLQIILAEEAALNKVRDPASGAYYIENLTLQLAQRSWQKFQEMEKKGGLLNAISSGHWQSEIKNNALKQEKAILQGTKKAIGVNIYQTPDENVKLEPQDNYYRQGKLFEDVEPLILKRIL